MRGLKLLVDAQPSEDAAVALDGVVDEIAGDDGAQKLGRQRLESPVDFAPRRHADTESHKDSTRQQNYEWNQRVRPKELRNRAMIGAIARGREQKVAGFLGPKGVPEALRYHEGLS